MSVSKSGPVIRSVIGPCRIGRPWPAMGASRSSVAALSWNWSPNMSIAAALIHVWVMSPLPRRTAQRSDRSPAPFARGHTLAPLEIS